MVASAPIERESQLQEMKLPRPDRLPDGSDPEARVVICGLSWQSYLDFDEALGDDRPGPRFYYLEGELEIMTTSREHERVKKRIASLLDIFFEETEVETMTYGQATMRL